MREQKFKVCVFESKNDCKTHRAEKRRKAAKNGER
jgi:hypothetical protein